MKQSAHQSITTYQQLSWAIERLGHQFKSADLNPEKAISLCFDIQRLLEKAYDNHWTGVISKSLADINKLYEEVAISSHVFFVCEETYDVLEVMAKTLPSTNLDALRFYIRTTKAGITSAVKSFIATSNVYDNSTLKSDAYFILRAMASKGSSHDQAALLFAEFLADVSSYFPQIMSTPHLMYSLCGYYGGLQGPLNASTNKQLGRLIEPRVKEILMSGFVFETPRVEDALSLIRNGHTYIGEWIIEHVFPHADESAVLMEIEKHTSLKLQPLADRLKRSTVKDASYCKDMCMLTTYFLCSNNDVVKFTDLDFLSPSNKIQFPSWIADVLDNPSGSCNEARVRQSIEFFVDGFPDRFNRLKKNEVIRDFMKTIPTLSDEILAEDLGL
jgi:hypothetical protein